jgi:hypothetical protein
MLFDCPNSACNGSVEKIDGRYFNSEQVQGSDDLNMDPLADITKLIELWYCCFCGQYFRAYYKLEHITRLTEQF